MNFIQISYCVTNFCIKNLFYSLVLGLLIAFQAVQAADECHFAREVKYCQYGCCDDVCCSMTETAIILLIIGTVLGVASLVGCIICMSCIFKQQTTAAVVHPAGNKANKLHVNKSPNDSLSRGRSTFNSEDSKTNYKIYSMTYKHSEPRSGKYYLSNEILK